MQSPSLFSSSLPAPSQPFPLISLSSTYLILPPFLLSFRLLLSISPFLPLSLLPFPSSPFPPPLSLLPLSLFPLSLLLLSLLPLSLTPTLLFSLLYPPFPPPLFLLCPHFPPPPSSSLQGWTPLVSLCSSVTSGLQGKSYRKWRGSTCSQPCSRRCTPRSPRATTAGTSSRPLCPSSSQLYPWSESSTYIKSPPFFDSMVSGGCMAVAGHMLKSHTSTHTYTQMHKNVHTNKHNTHGTHTFNMHTWCVHT